MATSTQDIQTKAFDYKQAAEAVLKSLRRDRDRQIIARRFGFELAKRQTLEEIGRHFGITRERVRQIEKATLAKLRQSLNSETRQAGQLLSELLAKQGGVVTAEKIAALIGIPTRQEQSYITFLASLAPEIAVIEEDDSVRSAYGVEPEFNASKVHQLVERVTEAVAALGSPSSVQQINQRLNPAMDEATLASVLSVAKKLATHEKQWGLIEWPSVNPKSIRDKTYLVLSKHGQPLHFGEIADHIKRSNFTRRDVTVQAVHNELIKDSRFVLIGRGIYALAEWGYTPGTVADIIIDILKGEAPLHKDEIVKRVLKKRQVKTTTIVLNLQEKEQFERVAKATYKLKGQ